MEFEFKVTVTVERDQGKFASKDELASAIEEELSNADPGNIEGENGGEYSVTDWNVERVS